MSADIEDFYVERSDRLLPLLPGDVEWEQNGEDVVAEGDGWLLTVAEPERVEPAEIPDDLRSAVPGLSHRVFVQIEPIDPPDDAWELLNAVLDAIGVALGGAAYDPLSGHAITWRDGRRTHA